MVASLIMVFNLVLGAVVRYDKKHGTSDAARAIRKKKIIHRRSKQAISEHVNFGT